MSTMRHLRAVLAAVVCVVVAGVGIASCGDGSEGAGSEGPAGFLSHEGGTAVFVQWTRAGDDVSGTFSEATQPEGGFRQASAPFKGTVRDGSVMLQIRSGVATLPINGRLDGDTLELTIPRQGGALTRRLTSASKDDYTKAMQDIRDR